MFRGLSGVSASFSVGSISPADVVGLTGVSSTSSVGSVVVAPIELINVTGVSATLSVGIFASSLSSNQLVSLVVGSGILSFLTFIDFVSSRVTGVFGTILNELQLGGSFSLFDSSSFGIAEGGHFADFARGIINFYDIIF